jgi:hypothetical protein
MAVGTGVNAGRAVAVGVNAGVGGSTGSPGVGGGVAVGAAGVATHALSVIRRIKKMKGER